MGDSASPWILLWGLCCPSMASAVHSDPEKVPLYLLCLASGDSRMHHFTSGPGSKSGGVSLGEDAGMPSCTLSPFALTVVLGFISQCEETYW